MATSIETSTRALVARQPVYDRALNVVAYELIVEGADPGHAISELGLSLVAGQPAYIPLTRDLLLGGFPAALPPDRVVLQLGPAVEAEAAAEARLGELVASGYRLAVTAGVHQRLLPLASVVAVTADNAERPILRDQVARIHDAGAKALARGVEEHDDLEMCLELGFELLQGHFICRPRMVSEGALKVLGINRVRLLAELQDEAADFDALQAIIGRDIGLSYNLLRFINSAFFSLPRRVESIRDALVLLGLKNVRKWATLMAFADVQDKPRELVVTGLVRARMCELLAFIYAHPDREGAFTTGLFSVVDALTDRSMVELLSTLPLSREIIEALLNHDGTKGRILRTAIAYEQGNFAGLLDLPPSRTSLADVYAEAVAWATEASGSLAATA